MNQRFPPQSTRNHDIAILLELMDTVIENRTAIYLSTAITTGKRFTDWHAALNVNSGMSHPTYLEEYRKRVVEPNRAEVQRLVRGLRNKLGQVVINPTALKDLPRWTQDDYRVFWARVIENYVSKVVFANGWQYSNGCAYEFLIAHNTKVHTVDQKQRPLPFEKGVRLIRSAIEDMEKHGVSTKFLQGVLTALLNLKIANFKDQWQSKLNS
jgi:hypothetical protein